jgi:hypothetical protein
MGDAVRVCTFVRGILAGKKGPQIGTSQLADWAHDYGFKVLQYVQSDSEHVCLATATAAKQSIVILNILISLTLLLLFDFSIHCNNHDVLYFMFTDFALVS